jgi:hypothetical protein
LKTEHEARLQWQELTRTLNQYDLYVSRPEIRPTPLIGANAAQNSPRLSETLVGARRHHNV